jgi:DNA repair exonuclease SbcCD ATPase subunit
MPKKDVDEDSPTDRSVQKTSIIKLVDDGETEVVDVYHISDIHIRNTARHQEYRSVFDRTYRYLTKTIGNNSNTSLIILTGDIMHTKTEMSPESFTLAREFFEFLAMIAPVILIPGNHDCNLSNTERMDALSPIVYRNGNISIKNLYYLKHTGFYQYHNIVFGVTSIFDNIILTADKIPKHQWKKIKQENKFCIALYHGPVHGARTDVGFRMNNEEFLVEHFEGYDYVMLGDIHRYQYLNEANTVAYAGSLIQQSHGEKIKGHGVLHWDLSDGSSKLHEIRNDYGYHTIKVNNGEIEEELKLPRYPRLRFILENTNQIQYNDLVKKLSTEYEIQEIVKESNFQSSQYLDTTLKKKHSVKKFSNQESVIRNYLAKKGHDNEIIDSIVHLHNSIHKKVFANDQQKIIDAENNKKWKILELRFSNTLSYGADNVIDFTRYDPNNIIGIVAPNHYGKSAILDVILFCLFDKCSRGERRDILNKNENAMYCSLLFSIGNQKYLIERIGQRSKNGLTVKIDVNFYQYQTNKKGKEIKIKLNGTDKNDTNRKIGELIGDYQDYLTTCFCLQQGRTVNFIEMTQLQKKEYLHEILKLNVFETCHNQARDKLKDLKGQIKTLEQRIGNKTLEEHKTAVIETGKALKKKIKTVTYYKYLIEEFCQSTEKPILVKYQELADFHLERESDIDAAIAKLQKELGKKTDVINENDVEELRKDVAELELAYDELQEKRSECANCKEKLLNELVIFPKSYQKWSHQQFEDELERLQIRIDQIKNQLDDGDSEDVETELEQARKKLTEKRKLIIPVHGYTIKQLKKQKNLLKQAQDQGETDPIDPLTIPLEIKILNRFHQDEKILLKDLKQLQKYIDGKGVSILENLIESRELSMTKLSKRLEQLNSTDTESLLDVSSIAKMIEEIETDLEHQESNKRIQEKIDLLESSVEKMLLQVGKREKSTALRHELKDLHKRVEEINQCMNSLDNNHELEKKIQKLKDSSDKIEMKLPDLKKNLREKRTQLTESEELIKNQKKQKEQRETKKRQINLLNNYRFEYYYWSQNMEEYQSNHCRHAELVEEIEACEKEITKYEAEMMIRKKDLADYLEIRREYDKLNSDINLYELYIRTMNYNGLPYEMLKSYLPMIEADVNQILHEMVAFNVEFKFYDETDTKTKQLKSNTGTIDVDISYQNSKSYNVQLTSGFEKFIINLAIRMTLCQISLTSKPNFLIIDEGWSCLDRENLNNIDTIMNYIKSQYDHVIIISHLEELRNQSDYVINIDRRKGKSYLSAI